MVRLIGMRCLEISSEEGNTVQSYALSSTASQTTQVTMSGIKGVVKRT